MSLIELEQFYMRFLKQIFSLNQKGIIHLIPLFLLLAGIIAGVYLVQHPQIFKPKASGENIKFEAADGKDSSGKDCRVYTDPADNKLKTTCPTVNIKFTSPLETNQTTDAGFELVKTAYAVDPVENGVCKKEDISKIYNHAGEEKATCPENSTCGSYGNNRGVNCADSFGPVFSKADGWYCGKDELLLGWSRDEGDIIKDTLLGFLSYWNTDVFSCNDGAVCKTEGNTVSCVAKKAAPAAAPGGKQIRAIQCTTTENIYKVTYTDGSFIEVTCPGDQLRCIQKTYPNGDNPGEVKCEPKAVLGPQPASNPVATPASDAPGSSGGGGDQVKPPVCESITVKWGDNIRGPFSNGETVEVPDKTSLEFIGKIRNDDGKRDSIDWRWNIEEPFKAPGWDRVQGFFSPSVTSTAKLYMKIYGVPQPACETNLIVIVKQTTPSSGGKCTTSCIYSQQDENGVQCYSGNCKDGSTDCGFNNDCVYAAGCTQKVACPGAGGTGSPAETVPVEVEPTIECQDDPRGERSDGYKWKADCLGQTCTSNDSCPRNELDPRVTPEDSNWCYPFIKDGKSESKCLVLKYEGNVERVTVAFRFSEDVSDFINKDALWQKYPPAAPVPYTFKDTKLGPKFIYAQFKDNQDNIINANSYPVQIELVAEEAAATPTPTSKPTSKPKPISCKVSESPRNCSVPNVEKCNIVTLADIGNCTNEQLLATLTPDQLGTIPISRMETFGNGDLMCSFPTRVLSRMNVSRLKDFSNEDLLLIGDASGNCGKFLSNFNCDRIDDLPPEYQALTSCGN